MRIILYYLVSTRILQLSQDCNSNNGIINIIV